MVVLVTVVTTVVLVAGAYDIWPRTSSGRMLSRGCEGVDPARLVLESDDAGEPALAEDDVGAAENGVLNVVRTRVEDCVGFP